MAVSTITLASSNGDSVVVSSSGGTWMTDEIILDTDPKGMYDTGFAVRTQSGAFENGGRVVGIDVPIRTPTLPFWLTPASRKRFQKMWGSPGFFQKVKCTWDGPSGPRFLMLRLSKEIDYTTENGLDADIDTEYHAVVVPIALNPMFEGVENDSQFVNPDDRFTAVVVGTGGTFTMTFTPNVGSPDTTAALAYNISTTALQTAIQGLASVGAGNATVTGSPGNYLIVMGAAAAGVLTGDGTNLTGTPHSLTTDYAPNTGYFSIWNPTDQPEWLEWNFDPAKQWQFPDFSFGQELKWNRPTGADAARMIVTPQLTQLLSVMADPLQDTYVNADLSNAAGLFNGVEPLYAVPPYTSTVGSPTVAPVIVKGPKGAKATLRQRRFWSAESGLE